ncbi:HET-domain-containing protein, partial [Hyaloscypha variabilis F]
MPPQVEAANSRYIYQPILQSNSIRLLTLFPGTKGTTIQCELQEVSLSNNRPPYCALSYVWGDPSVTAGIRVHCRELQVTTNLQSALQCLRLCDTSRILWIDAICIDQGNLTERNEQIQYMVQIYSLAANVLIWLGNDDSIHHAFNIRLVEKLSEDDYMHLGAAFNDNSWWSRAWVIQEVIHASEV